MGAIHTWRDQKTSFNSTNKPPEPCSSFHPGEVHRADKGSSRVPKELAEMLAVLGVHFWWQALRPSLTGTP